MMKIEYQRNLKKSYMRLRELESEGGYEEKVLMKNKIPGLLYFQSSFCDGEKEYWYETGGRQSLDLYAEVNQLDEKMLVHLLSGICQAVGNVEKYLLDANRLLLQAETIFVKLPQKECMFCYCPAYDENLLFQLRRLAEFLITKVDHKSEEAVKLVYAFYEMTIREEFKMEDLKQLFQKRQEAEEIVIPANQGLDVRMEWTNTKEERQKNFEFRQEDEFRHKDEDKNKDTDRKKRSFGEYLQTCKEKVREQIQSSIQGYKQQFLKGLPSNLRQKLEQNSDENITTLQKQKRNNIAERQLFAQKKEKERQFLFEPEEEETITEHPTVLLAKTLPQTCAMLVYEGMGEQESLIIEKTPFVIGSDASKADGVINSRSVSRQHARITTEGGVYFIEDLNSTNGTMVGGEELNYKVKVGLQPREQIIFANEPFRFC